MRKPTPDFRGILRILRRHEVDFVVVGGICGVLQGAPLNTFDLDIVHSRDPSNLDRLLKALQVLRGRYRTPGHSKLKPRESHLASPGHQLLMTSAGPLDLLGTIGDSHSYEDLVGEAKEFTIGKGLTVQVLDLVALIRIKAETAQEKDKAQLAILRRTLEEQSRN